MRLLKLPRDVKSSKHRDHHLTIGPPAASKAQSQSVPPPGRSRDRSIPSKESEDLSVRRAGITDGVYSCFAVTGIQGSSVVLTCLRWSRYPSQLESCTGCRRITGRSKSVSRGITRICVVTVFTNIYWRWVDRTENLPFGSAGLL